MSKIVCDICGTSYPETAKQCPICGSVRPGDAQRVSNEGKGDGKVSTGYTYVKGGRFSKSNVKKRAKTQASGVEKRGTSPANKRNDDDSKSNRGLVATAIVLLLAIIGVVIYIAVRFFAPISDPNPDKPSDNLGSQIDLSCKDLTLDTYNVLFDQEGAAKLLDVKTTPEEPSEAVTYHSDNEAVATVTDRGKITAVGEGTAKITVTCGSVTKECIVTVQLGSKPTTEPSTGPTEPDNTTQPTEKIRLNRKDFSLFYKGDSWVLYNGEVAKNLITWSSDDEAVATFIDGKVVAVGNGMTMVHAEYNGQKVSCTVRCSFKEGTGVNGNGGVSEDGNGSSTQIITGTVYNVQTDVNIRKGPGISYGLNGSLKLGEKVTITETRVADGMTWGKLGTDKWVSMTYIKTN